MARLAAAALVLVLAGCGDAAPRPAPERLPRIYSSLPHAGELRDVYFAALLAMEEQGRGVEHVPLDSDRPDVGHGWEAGVVSDNARRAAADPRTLAYVGEIAAGAATVSKPILGAAGIAQVAPGGTWAGLTRAEPATHFVRVIPADHLQADATVSWMERLGTRRLLTVSDREEFGDAMARMVAARARAAGIAVSRTSYRTKRLASIRAVADRVRAERPDTLYFGGIWQNRGAALWSRAHRAGPRMRLMGPDTLADPAFTRSIPRSSRARTFLVDVRVPPAAAFARRFRARFGHAPHPLAPYGYDAMERAITAVRAGRGNRRAVVNAAFEGLDEHGDLRRGRFGAYRVSRDGELRLERELVGADD